MADKKAMFTASKESLVVKLSPAELGLKPRRVWNPSPSNRHRTKPYDLPQSLSIGIYGNELTGAKFSPPPFAVVVEGDDGQSVLIAVAADAGWHRWNGVDFAVDDNGVRITIDLEGHTSPGEAISHVWVDLFAAEADESHHTLLARGLAAQYPGAGTDSASAPAWWRRPIYCGWGDQVATSLWMEGPGAEERALAYCIEGLYERWVRRLDEADVPFGTTTIDHGWAPAGSLVTDEIRWPDLKGFIAREHERGRKVLLWTATWLWDGLPDEWCVFVDGRKLVADPTNPDYLAYLREKVSHLLSPDGLNADGFKVDQLAYAPSQRHPRGGPRFGHTDYYDAASEPVRLHGDSWGTELLYAYQKTIYDAAKAAKPDALVTSSTVHPYFHDSFDMVRLHDTGPVVGDVIDAMRARADLAQAALPGKLIDTDDWVLGNYDRWMDYTMRSMSLGVPCIFYSERFVNGMTADPPTRDIPLEDLKNIAETWRREYDTATSSWVTMTGSSA